MNKYLLPVLLGLITTCCTPAPLMEEKYFVEVTAGTEITSVEKLYGEPYEIRALSNGQQEYSYVKRIDLGRSAVDQQEFVFRVDQGKIVGKECKNSGTTGFQFSN